MAEPVNEIIPRDFNDPQIENFLNEFSSYVEDTVNFGSQVLKWDATSNPGGDENIPILLSLRHYLELLDSISILVKTSSIEPCKLIMRGLLETYFNLEYLLEKDTKNRCMAFMAWHYYKRLKFCKKLVKNSEQGKQFQQIIKKDKILKNYQLPEIPILSVAIKNLESILSSPPYQPAMREIEKYSKNRKEPNWYSLFDGPKNLHELTDRLSLNLFYEFFFRNYSGTVHGADIIEGKISTSEDKKLEIIQIRTSKNVQDIIRTCLTLSFKTFGLVLSIRNPERLGEYLEWRETNREFYKKISTEKDLLITI